MINVEHHSHDTLDVEEIAAFTFETYSTLPIPYKYGNTLEEIRAWLSDPTKCPDFISIAREDEEIRGWAGVYHWTNSMIYQLAWHPLVNPPDIEIGKRLIHDCIEYTESSGRNRMEVFLMEITDEYRDYAATCGEMYTAAGMKRGYEWTFMDADLKNLDFSLRDIPENMHTRSLTEISNDELWPDYDRAFSSGGDRRYTAQSNEQRRENFESFFSREVPIEEEASIVLFDGETIVGFVKIDIHTNSVFVHGIGVVPEYRGQGFAKYVLGTSMMRAAENNHALMKLEVDIENKGAIRLYESLGFKHMKGSISYIWEK
ncbi:MAG: GNAT family N-acetyltransferase [Candidatus Thorarchaeota archaeon]|nr:MAG: GNAT family N-acetyltransferase [Candidatus Thorarchaeota archaeon]